MNGRVMNIRSHNQRFNASRKQLFGILKEENLRKYIKPPLEYTKGLVKCRILYSRQIEDIHYIHYAIKPIRSLQLVECNFIEYNHKFEDRKILDECMQQASKADDMIIVKNGLLTDSYYCNIALLQKGIWYTPETPLLEGTMRALLLKNKKIQTRNMAVHDMNAYTHVSLFNAMIPHGAIVLPACNIL